jgi:hypothetical protein
MEVDPASVFVTRAIQTDRETTPESEPDTDDELDGILGQQRPMVRINTCKRK